MCHLRYACACAMLAAMVSVGCDRGAAPAVPTNPGVERSAATGVSIASASASAPASAEWRCLVSTAFRPVDCPLLAVPVRVSATAFGPSPPANPQVLTAMVAGARVTLSWSPPTAGIPPTSYVLEAGSAPGLNDLVNSDTGSTRTFFAADSVPPGTYFVRVRAKSSGGTSDASNEVQVIVGGPVCTTAPGVPTLSVSVVGLTFTLTWSAAPGATSYVVEGGSGPGETNLANFDTGSTSTTYTTLVDPGTYYVRVRSKNACGRSNASNEVSAYIPMYTIQFRPLLHGLQPAPCGYAVPGGLCAQAVVPRGPLGAFSEVWVPGTPLIKVDGNITTTTFTATLQCVNGAASGSINATWDGSKYVGTWTFGGGSGNVRVERGLSDTQCMVP